MIPRTAGGGWRRNGGKVWCVKQGDPPVTEHPRGWQAEVRGAVVARKRSNVRGAKGARKVEARWTDEAKHHRT